MNPTTPHSGFRRNATGLVARLFATAFAMWALAAGAHATTIEVLAVVDGTPVTNLDFEERRNFLVKTTGIPDNEQTAPQIDKDVLQMLIDDVVKRDEGLKLGGGIEVTARLHAEDVVRQSFSQHGEDPNEVMRRLGIDREFAVDKFLTDVLWASTVQARFAEEFSNIPAEAELELERIKANALKPQINLDEIVLVPEPNRTMPQTMQVARQMAEAIRGGADFGRIAQQFSVAGTNQQGGAIGWLLLERLPDAIRGAVESLPAGSVADPVEIDGAVVVYRVNGIRSGGASDPLEARVRVGRLVLPVEAANSGSREEAAAQVAVETAGARSCEDLRRIHEGYGSGRDFDFGEFALRDTAARLREMLLPLGPGEMTGPIDFSDGIVVFMVCDKSTPPAVALPAFAEIESRIRNRHFSVLSSRYLNQLRRRAIIDHKAGP